MKKVSVFGAAGKMGSAVVKAVKEDNDLELIGAIDINQDSGNALSNSDVVVDFTNPEAVEANVMLALDSGVHAVVGTTGLSTEAIGRIRAKTTETGKNVFIAPNFAIGAVLMMELAKKAAPHMDNVEIIEYHHNQKVDAPSGTAMKTASELEVQSVSIDNEQENVKGSRGGLHNNIRIHSVRLPGLVAHQEVIFGSPGQTLTIRHDSLDRVSFMPGVIAAVKAVGDLPGVTIGLEKLFKI